MPGNLLLGTTNTSYNGLGLYSVTWNNALLGTNVLTAVATDNNGITTTSAPPVNVIVDASPTITITNPAIGALIVAPTTNLVISATASASVGISRVQFFTGTNSLGVATTSPYSVTGNNLPTGTNLLKAVAVGNDGFTATSSVVHVIVDIPPVVTLTNPANNAVFATGSRYQSWRGRFRRGWHGNTGAIFRQGRQVSGLTSARLTIWHGPTLQRELMS